MHLPHCSAPRLGQAGRAGSVSFQGSHVPPPSVDRNPFCSVQAAAVVSAMEVKDDEPSSPGAHRWMGVHTDPGPIKVGLAAGNVRQVSWARGGALAPHPKPRPGALFRPGRRSLEVPLMPRGLSPGKRSRGIAALCPEGRPRCGPQCGDRRRSQSRSHPAHRKGREGTYAGGTWTRLPGWGASTTQAWGPLPALAPVELPLLLSPQNHQKDPLLGLHQVCPDLRGHGASVQPALGSSCPICAMGLLKHWLSPRSLPGLDLGLTRGGRDLGGAPLTGLVSFPKKWMVSKLSWSRLSRQ